MDTGGGRAIDTALMIHGTRLKRQVGQVGWDWGLQPPDTAQNAELDALADAVGMSAVARCLRAAAENTSSRSMSLGEMVQTASVGLASRE